MKSTGAATRVLLVIAAAILTLATMSVGRAAAGAQSDWASFSTYPYNSCNAELVAARGTAHRVQIAQADGEYIQLLQFHVTVVGSQGNQYVLNWQERYDSNSVGYEYSSRQLVISKGSEPNQLQTFTVKVTYNPFSFEYVSVTNCLGAG